MAGAPHDAAKPPPPLPPPIGAQGAGAPRVYVTRSNASLCRTSACVECRYRYVYELPPRFNAWMHAGEHGWWQELP